MKLPLLEHPIVKPGTMWKSAHPLLMPRWKLFEGDLETYVMVVHLELRRFEAPYNMNYVEVYLLTEDAGVQSLILMENSVYHATWLDQFYSYCIRAKTVIQ